MLYSSSDIAKLIEGETDHDIAVSNLASLKSANKDSISFFSDFKYKDELKNTKAGIVILKKDYAKYWKGPSIFVEDPYLAFAKVSSLFSSKNNKTCIDKSSVIGNKTIFGKKPYVGPNCSIGSNCSFGDNVEIIGNVFISDNVIVGNNVVINSNVTIERNVVIGNNCEFLSGSKIGTEGFGYAREKNKSWLKIPQIGSVIIGNNVDVGANSTIDRGAIENTIIEDGVKIDNLVQIGHNCHIGKNTIIAGCAGIAGSARIGKNCMIGGAAMIKGHIIIADDTIISGGTGIGRSVNDPGKRFTNVFPYNIEHKDWLRIANNLKKIGKKND